MKQYSSFKQQKTRQNASIQLGSSKLTSNINPESIPNSSYAIQSKHFKQTTVSRLVEDICLTQRRSKQLKQERISLGQTRRASRNIRVNVMRLQDKEFSVNKNIYNICIGQLNSKECRKVLLQSQLQKLKQRIKYLQNQKQYKRNQSKTIQSNRYRNYVKNNDYRQNTFFANSTIQQNNQANNFSQGNTNTKLNQSLNDKQKQFVISARRSLCGRLYKKNQLSIQKSQEINSPIFQLKISQQHQKAQPQQKIQKQPQYDDVVVFREITPEFQITSIYDDFRDKILKKLQIPKQFPLKEPDATLTLEQQQALSSEVYKSFGIDLSKTKQKVSVQKFSNGIYYQLKPNKNLLRFYNGSIYFGEWQTSIPVQSTKNGFGFQYIKDKYYFLGNFKNGQRQGRGVMMLISKDNSKSNSFVGYDGQWLSGKPHGFGRHIDENNTKYIGGFKNGQRMGNATILSHQGLYYQGQVQNGLQHGKGIQKLKNGDQYTGNFSQGKFHGQGTYKWKNGNVYVGQFVQGKRQGLGKWTTQQGDVFQGQFVNDAKHGWGKILWTNGQSYQGYFQNDLRHGEGVYSHNNGKKGQYVWNEGQIDHRVKEKQQEQTIRIQIDGSSETCSIADQINK